MGNALELWRRLFAEMPLIAILRGIRPSEVQPVADILIESGFLCAEVPLNSPDALGSIERLRVHASGRLVVGAGTVLSAQDVRLCNNAGAQIVISPNVSIGVIAATKKCGLISVPGFSTPTEAFTAIEAGADAVKLFPAEAANPVILRALKAVLPAELPVIPVGSITVESLRTYRDAGAAGFGIGSALFKPGIDLVSVRRNAQDFVGAWRKCLGR